MRIKGINEIGFHKNNEFVIDGIFRENFDDFGFDLSRPLRM